jgi:hypothetical protein
MQPSCDTSSEASGPPAGTASGDAAERAATPTEIGGPQGPEPTRFGDWERKGRCIDF